MLYGSAGEFDFVIGAWAAGGSPGPEGYQNRKSRNEGEENKGLKPTTQQEGQEAGNSSEGASQYEVGEALVSRTVSWQRTIVNGW